MQVGPFDDESADLPTVGITNLGNTCFVGASLQALFGAPVVYNAIRALGAGDNDVIIIGDSWAHGVHSLTEQMSAATTAVSPNELLAALVQDWLDNGRQCYHRGHQMDASEFIQRCVERITPLQQLITFTMQQISNEQPPPDPVDGYVFLPVPVLSGFSLQALVHYEYAWPGHQPQIVLTSMPGVLVVALKRFVLDDGRVKKDSSRIVDVDSLLIYNANNETTARYSLEGVVHHIGATAHAGHYTAE